MWCRSDNTGAQWCYTEYGATCEDLQRSTRWAVEAGGGGADTDLQVRGSGKDLELPGLLHTLPQ